MITQPQQLPLSSATTVTTTTMVLVAVAETMVVVDVAGVETMVVVEVVPSLSNISGLSFPLSSLSGPLPHIPDSSSSGHIHGSHGPLHRVHIRQPVLPINKQAY
jgi:hypothetical protein